MHKMASQRTPESASPIPPDWEPSHHGPECVYNRAPAPLPHAQQEIPSTAQRPAIDVAGVLSCSV